MDPEKPSSQPPIEDGSPPLPKIHTTSRLPPSSSSYSQKGSSSKLFLRQITIDHIATVLRNSLFHPFITLLIPLCLRAQATPYSHPSFQITTGWAILVSLYHILTSISFRIADGIPREFNWEDQVVVVTGGGGGLGALLVEVLGMKGVRVALLDVKERPKEGALGEGEDGIGEDVRWYVCDVGNRDSVEKVAGRIREELGGPTILINNAAATIDPQPLSSLSPESTTRTLNTNLHSAFHLLHTFLPDILHSSPSGGHIVTISSILSHFHPAHLAPYSASKAALSSLYYSLKHELRLLGAHHRVKTTLVETGQMQTDLFKGLETPSGVLAPVLETREVVREIVTHIERGEGGVVRLPEYAKWVGWYEGLPDGLKVLVRWASGIDKAMGNLRETEKAEEARIGADEKN